MNINYAQILENANARKDSLQCIEGMLAELPEQTVNLTAALNYFERLLSLETDLDAEATALIPQLAAAIRQVAYPLVVAKKAIEFVPSGWTMSHIEVLAHRTEDAQ